MAPDNTEPNRVALDQYKDHAADYAQRFKWILWYIVSVFFFESRWPWPSRFKVFLLKTFGATIGEGITIKPGVRIKFPWRLLLGSHVWIGEDSWLDNLAEIRIGSHVCISQGAYLLTGNHDYKKTSFDLICKPITLEDGVWIGAKAVVTPGCVVHTHAVIAAGSVLTRDAEAYTIYQGNPAHAVRKRTIESPKR